MTTPERRPVPRPHCPFCRAEWTDAMLRQLDSHTSTAPCSCCAGPHGAEETAEAPLPLATEDLCCAACGRAIYLKPPVREATAR